MTLGEQFREMGEERLTDWFHELDAEVESLVEGLSDADLDKKVLREGGFEMPVEMSLEVYVQALLIFFGKVTIYFRAMNKPLPLSVQEWIW